MNCIMTILRIALFLITFITVAKIANCQYYIELYKNNYINPFHYNGNPKILSCISNTCMSENFPLNNITSSFQTSVKLSNRTNHKIIPHLAGTYSGNFQVYNADTLLSKKVFHNYQIEGGVNFRLKENFVSKLFWLHWSNGESMYQQLSRSSDQINLEIEYKLQTTKFGILVKAPIPKRHDQNPDLFQRQGYFEFLLKQDFKQKYNLEVEAGLRFLKASVKYKFHRNFSLQFLSSFGYYANDQIINYNNNSSQFGLGISFN